MNNTFFTFLLLFFLATTQSVFAHPLLPAPVADYIRDNPHATEKEIESYFRDTLGASSEVYYGEALTVEDLTLKDLYDTGSFREEDQLIPRKEGETLSEESARIQDNLSLILGVRSGSLTLWETVQHFTVLGIEHILSGLDHVLFVVTLILIILPWRKILLLVTTFTVAHSLTLLLAGLGIVTVSSRIVEPLIALSIIVTALLVIFHRSVGSFQKLHSKTALVFIFGLFHGLGFASVFQELSVSGKQFVPALLFFNVGVEIGQLLIILICLPVLLLFARISKDVYDRAVQVIALLIMAMAFWWLLERVLIQ